MRPNGSHELGPTPIYIANGSIWNMIILFGNGYTIPEFAIIT